MWKLWSSWSMRDYFCVLLAVMSTWHRSFHDRRIFDGDHSPARTAPSSDENVHIDNYILNISHNHRRSNSYKCYTKRTKIETKDLK